MVLPKCVGTNGCDRPATIRNACTFAFPYRLRLMFRMREWQLAGCSPHFPYLLFLAAWSFPRDGSLLPRRPKPDRVGNAPIRRCRIKKATETHTTRSCAASMKQQACVQKKDVHAAEGADVRPVRNIVHLRLPRIDAKNGRAAEGVRADVRTLRR